MEADTSKASQLIIPLKTGILIAALYALIGKLGLMLALPPGYASPIFPPAGLAVAVAYLAGASALPWVFLGSLLLNLTVTDFQITLLTGANSIWIALASTVQAFVGGWLLRHLIGRFSLLDTGKDIARYLLSAPVICLTSSALSVTGLRLLGTIDIHAWPSSWLNWWIGDTLGVIVVFPLVMLLYGQPVEKWRQRRLLVALPTLLAFTLVVAGYIQTSRGEQTEILQSFRLQAQQFADLVQARFDEQENLLEQLDAQLSLEYSEPAARVDFKYIAHLSLKQFPMIQAIEWAPRVSDKQRNSFVLAQDAANPGFDIRQRNSAGEMVGADQRAGYFPITYLEPLRGNEEALGFDLASNPARKKTLLQAMRSGKAVATQPLHLVQEKAHQYGISLLKKVSGGINAPGLVAIVLRVGDFLEKSLTRQGDMSTRLTDMADKSVIYGDANKESGTLDYDKVLEFGGRQYRLEVAPTPSYLARHKGTQSWSFIIVGLFGTGILAGMMLLITGNTARVEESVKDRTRELSESNRELLGIQTALQESEVRYRNLFESTDDAIMLLEKKGFTDCNEATLKLFGLQDRNAFVGLHPAELSPPTQPDGRDSLEAAQEHIDIAFRDGSARFEWMHWRADNHQPFPAEVLLNFFKGETNLVQAVVRDISERKAQEMALRESRAKYQRLTDDIGEDFVIFRYRADNGVLDYVSDGIMAIFGLEKEAVIGKSWMKKINWVEEDIPGALDSGAALVNREASETENELRFIHPSGETRTIHTVQHASWINDDEPPFIEGIAQNVTIQKKAAEELRKAREQAETANRAKSQFLANMSHEIRTPMNAIIGLSQLALGLQLNDKAREYVQKVNGAALSLLRIINDILDFSKIEADKLELENTDFHLEDVFHGLSNFLGIRARDGNVSLMFDMPPVPMALVGDPVRLEQILSNLTTNAIKFTPGGGEVVVSAAVSKQGSGEVELHFSVHDTGIGISKDDQQRLFDSFSQADASTTRKYGGTGLGLAICKRLVEMMGGKIWLESEPGRGSTFHFSAQFGISEASFEQPAMQIDAGEVHLLVVDDSEASRTILVKMLAGLGFRVDEAGDGHSALQLMNEHKGSDPFDVVLMDWNIPDMDGVEIARRMQGNDVASKAKVIMVTAYGRSEVMSAARGVDNIATALAKPVTPSALLNGIMVATGRKIERGGLAGQPSDADALKAKLSGARLLLVEDNEINQDVAIGLLESAGISVDVAWNGQEALERLEHGSYDGVLMDCQMPVMDGYEATQRIRQQERFRELPVIAMTANVMKGDSEKSLAAGMNDHIGKPVDFGEMLRTLARWVTPSRQVKSDITMEVEVEEEVEVPELDGINTTDGLARVQGNRKLYLKLLRKVGESQTHFSSAFAAAVKAGDWESAQRMAHTLKGVAGNVGAQALQAACRELEAETKQKRAGKEAVGKVRKELARVLASVATLGAAGEPSAQQLSTDAVVPEVDRKHVAEVIERLASMSNAYDTEALALLEAEEPLLVAAGYDRAVQQLRKALEAYDFDTAKMLLSRLDAGAEGG